MGILGDIADFFGFGGGGGSSSVNYGVTSTVQGGDKPVSLISTIQGGNKDVGVDVGLDDVNIDVGGTGTPLATTTEINVPLPIKTEADIDFAVTQPINTNSDIRSKLDVEPVQVDLCIDVGFTKLPNACISQPYDSHFAVTVLGTEIVGFNWTGESSTIINDLKKGPHIEPGGRPRPHGPGEPRRTVKGRAAVERGTDGGLHVRLN